MRSHFGSTVRTSEAQLLGLVGGGKRGSCFLPRRAHVLCPKAKSAGFAHRALHEWSTASRWCLSRSDVGLTHMNDAHSSTIMMSCAEKPLAEMMSFWLCFGVPGL